MPRLARLDGRQLSEPVQQAAQLLASVIGQDLEQIDGDGDGDGVGRAPPQIRA